MKASYLSLCVATLCLPTTGNRQILADLFVSSGDTHEALRYDDITGASLGVFASGGRLTSPRGLTFGPDGNFYVGGLGMDRVLRFDGTTGAYIDDLISSGYGGLLYPSHLAFFPELQIIPLPSAALLGKLGLGMAGMGLRRWAMNRTKGGTIGSCFRDWHIAGRESI